MILPLVILYVITLVYLAITERFRNFASIIGLQGWILFAVALLRLHAINPLELIFIAIETLAFKALLVPAILFAMIRKTKINRVRRSGSSQSGSLLLSLMALAVSASITYYIADSAIDLVFFGVALYAPAERPDPDRPALAHLLAHGRLSGDRERRFPLFDGHRRRNAAAHQHRHPAPTS